MEETTKVILVRLLYGRIVPRMQSHVLLFFRTLSMMNKWSAYILAALEEGDASSVEVSRRISKMTSGDVYIHAGSVNESVKQLSRDGLIGVAEAPRGRIYHLTPRGREMLARLYRLSDALKKMQSSLEPSSIR